MAQPIFSQDAPVVPDHDIKLGATFSPRGYECINHYLNNEETVPTVEEEVKIIKVSIKAQLVFSKPQYVIFCCCVQT